MTIPSVVNKYQKAVFLNRIKTTNAILSEVMTRAVADYGDVSEWDFGSQVNTHNAPAVASKYFVPYLKQIKEAVLKLKYITKTLELSFEIFMPCVGDHCDSCSRRFAELQMSKRGKALKIEKDNSNVFIQ